MTEWRLLKIDRRRAIKWVLASAALAGVDWPALAAGKLASGTATDPDLLANKVGLWDRVLTEEELKTTAALCDMIIPEDSKSPSASKVDVHGFINEWVSAPFPIQQADQKQIREGLAWLNNEAKKRYKKLFIDLSDEQKTNICNDICYAPKAAGEFKTAAEFFHKMRDLAASAVYTSMQGMKDLQYIGNMPLTAFKGPPKEVLDYLKLT